jgi:hypothetical protein
MKPLVLFIVVFFQFDKISSSTLSFGGGGGFNEPS